MKCPTCGGIDIHMKEVERLSIDLERERALRLSNLGHLKAAVTWIKESSPPYNTAIMEEAIAQQWTR